MNEACIVRRRKTISRQIFYCEIVILTNCNINIPPYNNLINWIQKCFQVLHTFIYFPRPANTPVTNSYALRF